MIHLLLVNVLNATKNGHKANLCRIVMNNFQNRRNVRFYACGMFGNVSSMQNKKNLDEFQAYARKCCLLCLRKI